MSADHAAVLSLLQRVVDLHEEIEEIVSDAKVRGSAQSATLTQWTWLSHYFLRQLGGQPWEIPPLFTRVDGKVTRWEYDRDGNVLTGPA